MRLSELTAYKRVIIQMHDFPDADSIGSGYALQKYFQAQGAQAELVYGGRAKIEKPNLLMLMDALKIEPKYLSELPTDTDLLITVDCQRGAGNVFNFELPETADVVVIDHHRVEIESNERVLIRPDLTSCATVVWDMLCKENFEQDESVRNALFFGLFSDANGMSELRHPLDRDLADIPNDTGLIRLLKNSAITSNELDIIARALLNKKFFGGIGLFEAEQCDANLLGFTSDIVQQVVGMDCCIVYCLQQHGAKLSVRSAVREIMASEITAFICKGAGNGGGNIEKAGGFISFNGVREVTEHSDTEKFLTDRIHAYNEHYDLIYAGKNEIKFGEFDLYKKLPIPVGFAKSTHVFPGGIKITVRTLEGDLDILADEEIYFMIGIKGEVYPIKKIRFETDYNVSDAPYCPQLEYSPTIINRLTGEKIGILNHAQTCIPKNEKIIRAKKLDKATKVFTNWDTEKYFSGEKGDRLVANENSYDDCYIVRDDIFLETYAKI